MTTPTNYANNQPSNELDNELITQYQGLTQDLKNYFDTKQNDFLDQSKSSYPTPDNYMRDRGEFLVNSKIDNLETRRKEVWDFLTSEFKNNTKDKYTNAKMLSQNKKQMSTQKKILKEKMDEYNKLKDSKSTYSRQREIALYEYNRRMDQLFIMKIIGIVLIVCLILTVLTNKLLPFETIYLIFVIFGLLILYIIYYIYLKNPGRTSRKWDKYNFKQPELDIQTKSMPDNFDYDTFDKKLDDDFNRYLDTCKESVRMLATTPSPTNRP
jgi:hypothetical protein